MNYRKYRKYTIFLVIGLLIGVNFTSCVNSKMLTMDVTNSGKTLYVGGFGKGNYSTIQSAIDDASSGDTVFVYRGRYKENIVINKSIHLKGQNKKRAIIDIRSNDYIKIKTDSVKISNLKIQNKILFMGGTRFCIHSVHNDNISIQDNIIYGGFAGIYCADSFYSIIENNTFWYGFNPIEFKGGDFNRIKNNKCYSYGRYSLIFYDIRNRPYYNNIISGNMINGKPYYCYYGKKDFIIEEIAQIELHCCSDFIIRNCEMSNIDFCIFISNCDNGTITNNKFYQNDYPIQVDGGKDLKIINNEFKLNVIGVLSWGGERLTIEDNIFKKILFTAIFGLDDNFWYNISNNIITNCVIGIHIEIKANNISIINNQISCCLVGINFGRFFNFVRGFKDLSIVGNKFRNCLFYSIRLAETVDSDICYNEISSGKLCELLSLIIRKKNPYLLVRGGIVLHNDSSRNLVKRNTISDLFMGVFAVESSNNEFIENNFFSNDYHAYFEYCSNYWDRNYWNEPLSSPKQILGFDVDGNKTYDYDYNPAQEPYDYILNKQNLGFSTLAPLCKILNFNNGFNSKSNIDDESIFNFIFINELFKNKSKYCLDFLKELDVRLMTIDNKLD